MKADIRSSAETEALHWATDFFRRCKSDLTGVESKRLGREMVLQMLLSAWDNSDTQAEKIVQATEGGARLREFIASLMERGEKLPKPLRDFVIAFLRDPQKFLKKQRGRKPVDLIWRDLNIAAAVAFVATKWKFSETRRRDQRSGRPSASSIVKAALAAGANVHLSEDKIIKTRDRFDAMPAGGNFVFGKGRLVVGRGQRSWEIVKLSDDIS
jgi:hypothetical protein